MAAIDRVESKIASLAAVVTKQRQMAVVYIDKGNLQGGERNLQRGCSNGRNCY